MSDRTPPCCHMVLQPQQWLVRLDSPHELDFGWNDVRSKVPQSVDIKTALAVGGSFMSSTAARQTFETTRKFITPSGPSWRSKGDLDLLLRLSGDTRHIFRAKFDNSVSGTITIM